MERRAGSNIRRQQLVAEAARLRLVGRTEAALAQLRTVLKEEPRHVAANLAVAEVLAAQGVHAEALAALGRAAAGAPSDASVWRQYILALRQAGQKGRARKAVRTARVTHPERRRLEDIAEGRAAPLDDIAETIRQGQFEEAWRLGAARAEAFPEDPRLMNLLGVTALSLSDPLRAEAVLRRAIELQPDFVDARANLGLALLRQARATEAVALLETVATEPDAPFNLRVNLASAYIEMGDLHSALALTSALIAEAPADRDVIGIHCRALIGTGRADEALALLEPLAQGEAFDLHDILADALERTAGRKAALAYIDGASGMSAKVVSRLAALYAEWGELERAARLARKMAEADPEDVAAFRLLGLMQTWKSEDPLIDVLRAQAADEDEPPERRGAFGLVLAKACIDLGDDRGAFAALRRGNDILRSLVSYDVARDEEAFDAIAACWDAEAVAGASMPDGGPAPIFFVGLPRSGSTLVETILSRHPAVEALGETPFSFNAASVTRLTPEADAVRRVRRQVEPALTPSGLHRVRTDKVLANFIHVGVLAAAFPGARFIETQRDYRDTCLSIYQADLGPAAHPYSMNLEELARYATAYHRLMAHWDRVVGARLIRVGYESLVTDPDGEVPKLVEALGLPWVPACLARTTPSRRISTMSVAQARKPITSGSVGRWRRFASELAPLTAILEREGLVHGA